MKQALFGLDQIRGEGRPSRFFWSVDFVDDRKMEQPLLHISPLTFWVAPTINRGKKKKMVVPPAPCPKRKRTAPFGPIGPTKRGFFMVPYCPIWMNHLWLQNGKKNHICPAFGGTSRWKKWVTMVKSFLPETRKTPRCLKLPSYAENSRTKFSRIEKKQYTTAIPHLLGGPTNLFLYYPAGCMGFSFRTTGVPGTGLIWALTTTI